MKTSGDKDARITVRHPLLGDLSGKLLVAATRKISRCLALDVSESGLKLMSFEPLEAGTELILVVDDAEIPLRVVWVNERSGDVSHYICGVESQDKSLGLESLFSSKKWLGRKSS